MGFSLSQFLLWISEDSVAAHCWISESLSLSQLKCICMFQMAGALGGSCMVRWRNVRLHRQEERRRDEMMRGFKNGGKVERHRCVCTCTVMYINHILLIYISGKSHLPYVTIIHSDSHPFLQFLSSSTVVFLSLQLCSDRQSAVMLIS